MIHFTKWTTDQFEMNTTYLVGNDLSNYWKGKLIQDHINLGAPLSQSVDSIFNTAEKQINNLLFSQFKNSFLTLFNSSIVPLIGIGKYSSELLKEYIFEEVRMEFYPSLPSRKKCLYLCDDNTELVDIENTFNLDQTQYPHIIRIDAIVDKSTTCIVDAFWLDCGKEKYNVIRDRAKKYWSGKVSKSPKLEILLVGNFQITEIIR